VSPAPAQPVLIPLPQSFTPLHQDRGDCRGLAFRDEQPLVGVKTLLFIAIAGVHKKEQRTKSKRKLSVPLHL
jgi:hypothetical protein